MKVVATVTPSNRSCVSVGGVVMVRGGADCGFESGEAFFEGSGDGEEAEEGGFGDVVALVGVGEQDSA